MKLTEKKLREMIKRIIKESNANLDPNFYEPDYIPSRFNAENISEEFANIFDGYVKDEGAPYRLSTEQYVNLANELADVIEPYIETVLGNR